jgi:hypothetical protein
LFFDVFMTLQETVERTRDEGLDKKTNVKRIRFIFEGPTFSVDGVPWQDFAEGLVRFAERILGWRLIGKPEAI